MENVRYVELLGIVFTIIVGSLLHFTFELSGDNSFVALFSAVNESTWEHLKLLFFPYMLYTIFEYFYFGNAYPNFITAKCIGVLCGLILIPIMFYAYTHILGTNYFVLDIAIFLLSVLVSYLVSCSILTRGYPQMNTLCALVLTAIAMAFFVFTFYPPKCFLFLDPVTNSYSSRAL